MAREDDYDWLNDPFDEKKAAREQAQVATSSGTKLALGLGCAAVIVGVVVIAVLVGMGVLSLANPR